MSKTTAAGPRRPYGRFFLPGPTEVHPDVLAAQSRPMIGHRGEGIRALMRELQAGLAEVFVTERPVFVSTSSATGLMEAAVRNAGRTRILSLVNGAFSQRFADIGRACGFEVDAAEVPWGEAHEPSMVTERLDRGTYDAVTMVHSETSTGVLNDVRSLTAAVREFDDVLVLVDSVSGLGAAELRPDAWGIDFVLTGSQKALALPPGLAFGVASERMMERASRAAGRGYYFDLERFAENWEKHQTPSTPAVSLLRALQVQLGRMSAEGMSERWARHDEMARVTWSWVSRMRERGVGLSVLAPEGYRSPAVTAIGTAEGTSPTDVVRSAAERGWVIGGGYGKLKQTTFRIGHMGDHTVTEVVELLRVLESAFA